MKKTTFLGMMMAAALWCGPVQAETKSSAAQEMEAAEEKALEMGEENIVPDTTEAEENTETLEATKIDETVVEDPPTESAHEADEGGEDVVETSAPKQNVEPEAAKTEDLITKDAENTAEEAIEEATPEPEPAEEETEEAEETPAPAEEIDDEAEDTEETVEDDEETLDKRTNKRWWGRPY